MDYIMKVLIGFYSEEANAYSNKICRIQDFNLKYGEDVKTEMYVKDLFEKEGIELIPTIHADGYAQGLVRKDAFDFIENCILSTLKENLNEVDGIFLFLHGASNVVGLEGESGEHHIAREIRKITGPFLPIAVVMDPHGNVTQEMCDLVNIVTCYRQSPHTDRQEMFTKTARLLIQLLKNRKDIKPVYQRVPIVLGGERCVSTDEPLVSINKMLDEEEKSDKILSACYHIGYTRQDSFLCCAAVTVVPSSPENTEYAENVSAKIADYVFSRRKDFHFSGNTMEPEEALDSVLQFQGSPVFLTDSGDNLTAGGTGYNTLVLKQLLGKKSLNNKKCLIAAITDPGCVEFLLGYDIGAHVEFDLGTEADPYSGKVKIKGTIIQKGNVNSYRKTMVNIGETVTVSMDDFDIDIIVSNKGISYNETHQFEAAKIDPESYDVVIVKQGYIFPDLIKISKYSVMSLTEGTTYQYTERLPRRRSYRPIFPVDNI